MDIRELTEAEMMEPFENLISDHMEKRSEAELVFNMMKQEDPNSLTLKLAKFLGSSPYIESRKKYAVIFTKLVNEDDLLPFLHKCVTGDDSSTTNSQLKESVFLIYAQLAKDIGETIVPFVKGFHSLFRNTLNDETMDLDVRIASTNALISIIQCVSSTNEKERFQDLLPGVMRTLTDALSNGGKAKEVLKLLIEFAKNEPRFLRIQLVDVINTMFEIIEDESLEEKTRHLAVEFLITLVEAKKRAPGMMKRLPLFISRCFTTLLNLLLDIKDDPTWYNAENLHQLNEHVLAVKSGIARNSLKYLRRFSNALGGKSVAHIAKEEMFAYLAAPEWEKRHAALMALVQISEGCSKVLSKNLEQVMSTVLSCFQDPHPRVRWAACCAIAGMSIAFRPALQEQFHNQVWPALVAAIGDFQNPQLQACALVAICYFGQNPDPENLMPYLDDMINKLLILLQNDKLVLQHRALTALAYIADCAEEHIRTYYDRLMPQLKIVLRFADIKSSPILRATTMECISIIWSAVGKEKFKEDSKQVMEMLISEGLQVKTDDATAIHMLVACGRFCKSMKKDFLPYMSFIMPFFIQCAQLKPVMTILADSGYENYEFGDNSIEKITKEKERVLRTKYNACTFIQWYADILKEDFYPWIPQVVSVLIPLLKFYTHDEVRSNAVRAMPSLLRSVKRAVRKGIVQGGSESYFTKLLDNIIESLVEALHEEPMPRICALMLAKLNSCLQICKPDLINEDRICSIVNAIKHAIRESSSRKQELTDRAKMEDFDAEEAELLREERKQEEEVYKNVGKILHKLIEAFKDDFLPYLDELSSYLLPMLTKEKTTSERETSIRIFVDLMLELPEAALKYYEDHLPLILDTSNDEDPDVRMNALFGLRLWAECDHSSFKPFIGEALSRINIVIMHFNALDPNNLRAYDNAVSALGSICQNYSESIDLAQVIPTWLNCLPIKDDVDEAELVHENLCSMVERSDTELLGPDYQYLTKVVSIFAEVLCVREDLATEETMERMINLLRYFQQTLSPATWASACSLLLPQQEMELEYVLSPEEDVNL